jgi:hypothetical protein
MSATAKQRYPVLGGEANGYEGKKTLPEEEVRHQVAPEHTRGLCIWRSIKVKPNGLSRLRTRNTRKPKSEKTAQRVG